MPLRYNKWRSSLQIDIVIVACEAPVFCAINDRALRLSLGELGAVILSAVD
jgi:hypothetical protein